jgi:hypothetical protein
VTVKDYPNKSGIWLELVYTAVLKTAGESHVGSNPTIPTIIYAQCQFESDRGHHAMDVSTGCAGGIYIPL